MKKLKGFTVIELLIVVVALGVGVIVFSGLTKSDADRHGKCMAEATYIHEEDRSAYCINKMAEEDRNTAIMMSSD